MKHVVSGEEGARITAVTNATIHVAIQVCFFLQSSSGEYYILMTSLVILFLLLWI